MSSGNAQILGEHWSCDYIERVVSRCVAHALRQNVRTVYLSVLFSFYSSAGWSKFIRGKKIWMLKKNLAERPTNQFSYSPKAKKFYLSAVVLFWIEDVHNLLTPQERETIFGEPFPQDGKQFENIRFNQGSSVLFHPNEKQTGVSIYDLKSDHGQLNPRVLPNKTK